MSVEMNQHQLVIIDGKYDIVPIAIAVAPVPVPIAIATIVPITIPQPSATTRKYRRSYCGDDHSSHHHHKSRW